MSSAPGYLYILGIGSAPASAPVLISVIQGAKKNTIQWTWS